MSTSAITYIDPSGSILFLGAGFSVGATNIEGRKLPLSHDLRKDFSDMLGVSQNEYPLETLVEEVHSRANLDLYQILYRRFTVANLQAHQTCILSLPWRRIYTTNFDDTVEFHHSSNNVVVPSYTTTEPKPSRLQHGSIIHLHGAIRATTEDNVLEQLVLSESAYIRQQFEKSPWYDEFVRDLRFCDSCFFIGYNLRDLHISAILLQDPVLSEKTYFVTESRPDNILLNRIRPFGEVLPIGAEGFSELCKTLPKPPRTVDPHSLRAFKYIDPLRDKKTLVPPTPIEILNLVTFGTFNFARCLSTLPDASYIVPRHALADSSIAELDTARCLLVHSYIGNGKSVFVYILAHKLSAIGYRCFICRKNPLLLQRDLELLASFGRIVIIFDSYNTAIDHIERLSEALPNAKFIVTIRTAIQDVRLHEIQARLPSPLGRTALNGICQDDKIAFKNLLNKSGVRVTQLEETIDKCTELREVVLALYGNEQIKTKITDAFSPLLEDRKCRKVFIAVHLLNWVGHEADAGFLRVVTGTDAYAEMSRFPVVSRDVFRLDDDSVHVRSPMFSEYLIQNHFETVDILDSIYHIIVETVRRKDERNYQAILSSVMRFSNLEKALANDLDRLDSLSHLFDKLHRDIEVNQEPLFWLQYSILMTASENLDAAERFVRTAYSRAADRPKFRTFQIDTYALRLFLQIESRLDKSSTVERFDEIIGNLEKVRSMIWEESRRYHAVRVLEGIEPFVIRRVSGLSGVERGGLTQYLDLLITDLDGLPESVQMETGSMGVRNSVSRARERLVLSQAP